MKMTLYNSIYLSDIEIILHRDIISCHKPVLIQNSYIRQYIMCNPEKRKIHTNEIFPGYNDEIVILYIKYLYGIDEINSISAEMMNFLEYINDNIINFMKIPNIKDILSYNFDYIPLIAKRLTFDDLVSLDFYDKNTDDSARIAKNLLLYKRDNYISEIKCLYDFICEGKSFTDMIINLLKLLLQDPVFQKFLIFNNNLILLIKLIDFGFVSGESLITKHILSLSRITGHYITIDQYVNFYINNIKHFTGK